MNLKVYQVRYTEYGTKKWCYTNNYKDCYLSIQDLKNNINRILFTKEFYEKLKQYNEANLS